MRIADTGEPLACPSGTAGELATLKDRAHKAGFTLNQTVIDGWPVYVVSRWNMSRTLPDLMAVGTFLDRAGGTKR